MVGLIVCCNLEAGLIDHFPPAPHNPTSLSRGVAGCRIGWVQGIKWHKASHRVCGAGWEANFHCYGNAVHMQLAAMFVHQSDFRKPHGSQKLLWTHPLMVGLIVCCNLEGGLIDHFQRMPETLVQLWPEWLPSVQLRHFSTTCAIHNKNCEGWQLSDRHSTVAEHWFDFRQVPAFSLSSIFASKHSLPPPFSSSGQVENTEIWKQKYWNQSTEVRRKVAYQCIVPYQWLCVLRPCSQRMTLSLWCESQISKSQTAAILTITIYVAANEWGQTQTQPNGEWGNQGDQSYM